MSSNSAYAGEDETWWDEQRCSESKKNERCIVAVQMKLEVIRVSREDMTCQFANLQFSCSRASNRSVGSYHFFKFEALQWRSLWTFAEAPWNRRLLKMNWIAWTICCLMRIPHVLSTAPIRLWPIESLRFRPKRNVRGELLQFFLRTESAGCFHIWSKRQTCQRYWKNS